MAIFREINESEAKLCFLLDSESIKLWSYEQWESALKKKDNRSLAVYANEKFIGVCVYQLILDEAELLYLAIRPEHTRKGFGQSLFAEFLNITKKNNIKKIFLEVSSNNLSAIEFYKKFNFQTISVRKNYYKNGSDAILKSKVVC